MANDLTYSILKKQQEIIENLPNNSLLSEICGLLKINRKDFDLTMTDYILEAQQCYLEDVVEHDFAENSEQNNIIKYMLNNKDQAHDEMLKRLLTPVELKKHKQKDTKFKQVKYNLKRKQVRKG